MHAHTPQGNLQLIASDYVQVWDALHNLTKTKCTDDPACADPYCYRVEDNKGGSFLTMASKSGFIFGVINIVGNFGTVFVDQV